MLDPRSGIVKILRTDSALDREIVVGLGAVIDHEHVLTCAHVVNLALGLAKEKAEQPQAPLQVSFPFVVRGVRLQAHVVRWFAPSKNRQPEDIAVLRCETQMPDAVRPLLFGEPEVDQKISAYGYPVGTTGGNVHDGVVKGALENGWWQVDDDDRRGIFLQAGFSGSPAWDAASGRVAGIVVAAEMAAKQGVGYLIPASLLKQAWEGLLSQSPLELVLRRYCLDRVQQWQAECRDPRDVDKLSHYTEPHYSVLKEHQDRAVDFSGLKPHQDSPYERIAEDGDDAESELLKLMQCSHRLCITEDAGSGKTIFTRRLQAFLCGPRAQQELFGSQPYLVVRFERRKRSNWPEDYRDKLLDALADEIHAAKQAAAVRLPSREIARLALEQQRVVLILDALDQVGDDARIEALESFLDSDAGQNCRLIVTGRAYAVNKRRELFDPYRWKRARIDGFDIQQQHRYLRGLVPDVTQEERSADRDERDDAYRRSLHVLFPQYDDVAELLRIPVVLSLIRTLAQQGKLQPFRTRGDLYFQMHSKLMERAASKVGLDADHRRRRRWRTILAAVAFEMMKRGLTDYYAVTGEDAVYNLQEAASARCATPVGDDEWKELEQVGDWTDRCILEDAVEDLYSFKHKGMMEFYCGLHLAANTQSGWVAHKPLDGNQQQTVIHCGDSLVAEIANQEGWYWAWRFAIESSPEIWNERPEILCASLSELFRTPQQGRRPTELIYRAWHLFKVDVLLLAQSPLIDCPGNPLADEQVCGHVEQQGKRLLLPGAEAVVAEYRSEFQRWLDLPDNQRTPGFDRSPRTIARQLRDSFVDCPAESWRCLDDPDRDPYVFWMGSLQSVGYARERPRHQVRLNPFRLQATTVTREQYRLFDRQHENDPTEYLTNDPYGRVVEQYSPDDRCPSICVSWYDAFAFCKWLGSEFRLPTEAEWEYACRAGKDGERDHFHFGDSLTSHQANFDGNHPFPQEAEKGPYVGKTTPVGSYPENAWRLYDMHGNVWEWCMDWFDADYYAELAEWSKEHAGQPYRNPSGPNAGSSRVVRGGSWDYDAVFCRSACRDHNVPSFRDVYIGFRVLRVGS